MRKTGVVTTVLGVLLGSAAGAGPVHAREAAAAASYLTVSAPDSTLGARNVLRARVSAADVGCGQYAACRTAPPEEGTVVWTLVSRRSPDVHFRHRSVVQDGRARWRTPQLTVGGRWIVTTHYSGTEQSAAADDRDEFRVTRG